jgi:hypothetical protein
MNVLVEALRWQVSLLGSMLFAASCSLEGMPQGAAWDAGRGGAGSSSGGISSGGSDGGADSIDASGDAGETTVVTSCSTDASYAIVAIGGTHSSPSMLVLSGTPGPTCANPHPKPDDCCSFDRRELLLSPEQQTVGAHELSYAWEPDGARWTVDGYTALGPCTERHESYYEKGCLAWSGSSYACRDGTGNSISAIEVMSIDDAHITLKERAGDDAGTWGPAYTVPRCP